MARKIEILTYTNERGESVSFSHASIGKGNHRLSRWIKGLSYAQKSSYDRMRATDNRNKHHRRCR